MGAHQPYAMWPCWRVELSENRFYLIERKNILIMSTIIHKELQRAGVKDRQ